ncbi:hypothetical protein DKG34_35730 [Streptomyces sp. NWU49]|nr:hypothetical protein DKG34_35730 [Streptomyces sp. NWU49]
MHLCGGGHPVLDQYRQRQPVPTAGVDVCHRGLPPAAAPLRVGRRAYGTGQQPAPTRPPATKARPWSRCDNTAPDLAHKCLFLNLLLGWSGSVVALWREGLPFGEQSP